MTKTMTRVMKREAWTWYLPSHLVSPNSFVRGVNHVLSLECIHALVLNL